jgi:nucleoside-diphosphate kinase
MWEYTIILLKPDTATQKGIEAELMRLIRRQKLNLVQRRERKLTHEDVLVLYHESLEQAYFGELRAYMMSGKVVYYIVTGENALTNTNKLVGATDPAKAEQGSLRKIYGRSILKNGFHSSNANRVEQEMAQLYKDKWAQIKKLIRI